MMKIKRRFALTVMFCLACAGFQARGESAKKSVSSSAIEPSAPFLAEIGAGLVLCDRASKENIVPVDGREVLEKVRQLPMSTWNWISQGPEVRHMGPIAQDFYAAFGLGRSERMITTIDLDGVSLAAIQGLYDKLEEQTPNSCCAEQKVPIDLLNAEQIEKNEELKELQARVTELEAELVRLPDLIEEMSGRTGGDDLVWK